MVATLHIESCEHAQKFEIFMGRFSLVQRFFFSWRVRIETGLSFAGRNRNKEVQHEKNLFKS